MRAAAGVVGQTDDHLPCSMARRRRHAGAVVLHGNDGVVVAAVHAAGVFRGFPHITVCARNAGAVSAGCRHTHTQTAMFLVLTVLKQTLSIDYLEHYQQLFYNYVNTFVILQQEV